MDYYLEQTIYPIKDTNKLFFDYTFFKLFASKENYNFVVSHILETIKNLLKEYETFELHVNLFSFNTTSLAKHHDFLRIFSGYSNMFGDKLTDFYVYYTPSIMDSILKIITTHISTNVPKVILYTKKESENSLKSFLEKASDKKKLQISIPI